MSLHRPYVLSIAGFDPSAGAGILADIKTFESNGVYGLGVCSAITFQNDISFEKVNWISADEIIEQVKVLQRFSFGYVKIGIVESFHALDTIVTYLRSVNEEVRIVWDPVLKASAGFNFHTVIDRQELEELCRKLYLVTPNWKEAERMPAAGDAIENAREMSKWCNVLLKGGHSKEGSARDILFVGNEEYDLLHERLSNAEKHGSGCVLSSAITAALTKGNDLHASCIHGKKYVTGFLKSSDTLLGIHKNIEQENHA